MNRALIALRRAVSGLAVLFIVGVAFNAPGFALPPAHSPLLGVWMVDVSRLPMPLEARPKSVKFTFSDAGSGRWSINVDIIDATGKERNSTLTAALDGSVSRVQGDTTEADVAAAKLPEPNVLVLTLAKGGRPGSTRIYAVAPGGRSMVETATYFGKDGLPVMRTNHFTRGR